MADDPKVYKNTILVFYTSLVNSHISMTLLGTGFPIQISAWGGGTDGVGQRSDGGGLARDSRQIREVTKLDCKTLK